MRATSSTQLDLALSVGEDESDLSVAGQAHRGRSRGADTSSAQVVFPEFGTDSPVTAEAATARIAGRSNAASASQEEYEKLLAERQSLLDKKFDDSITRAESNRLEYVRWSLDRIEDARHGSAIDMLDFAVTRYEEFAEEVQGLHNQLRAHTKQRRR